MSIWRKKKESKKEEKESMFDALYSRVAKISDDIASLYSEAIGRAVDGETFRARIYGYLLKTKIPSHIGGSGFAYRAIAPEEAKAVGFLEGLRNPSLKTMLAYDAEVPYEEGHKLGSNTHKMLRKKFESAGLSSHLREVLYNLPFLP